jgi:molybdopterin molybdotransferase
VLTFEEALIRVLDGAPTLATERVALADARQRVLAEELRARTPLPPYDYSAMDGFAVSARSFDGEGPWPLPVAGESRTGRLAAPLTSGATCRIFTGAPIPEGADAVVMQEDVERSDDRAVFKARPTHGAHIRRAGEDLTVGQLALERGTALDAGALGLVAALDYGDVLVARRPRVVILSTGDELRKPGSEAVAGTIPESNGVAIAALAARANAVTRFAPVARDEPGETRDHIARALEGADLLVTIGGVSVGDHDVVRPALEAAGVVLDFYKVAMKPGKPVTFGRRGDTVVIGLPGNPVSAQVTFALFGLPLLRRMQGHRSPVATTRAVRLGAPLRQQVGRRGFYAATVSGDVATPLSRQASGSVAALAWADALVIVPADSAGYQTGDVAEALMLAEL